MRVFHRTSRLPDDCRGAAVAIGNFDGVHLGHRAVLAAARALVPARPPGVITFEPHPREVLQPGSAPPRIAPLPRKLALLREAGVGFALVLRFDAALMAMPAERFVADLLVGRVGAAGVAVGRDFRFGHGRAGDGALLERLGAGYGFATAVVDAVSLDDTVCSSTRVRALIGEGEVAAAARVLGAPYRLEGSVVEGDRRGRELGFPTANLRLRGRRPLVPANGVYAVRAVLPGGAEPPVPAVANLGYRPTFAGQERRLEVHLLERGRDLYGRRLAVDFIERLRGEIRFSGIDALKAQIAADVAQARSRLAADAETRQAG